MTTTISLIKENLIPAISLLVVMIPLTLYWRAETKTEIKEFKDEVRGWTAESKKEWAEYRKETNKKWEESNKRWEDYRKESDAKWLAANKRSDELYKALIKERK